MTLDVCGYDWNWPTVGRIRARRRWKPSWSRIDGCEHGGACTRDQTFVRAVSVLAARSLTEHCEDAMVDLVHEAVAVASDVSVPLEQLLVRRHQVNLLEGLGRPRTHSS